MTTGDFYALDARIERVIASVPDLCPRCGGEGWIETAEHDGDFWYVGHEPCPTCAPPVEGEL